jgi:hypothetical protein
VAGSQEAAMDRFFSRKYRRYLQILADPRDEAQRKIILKLLAEEEVTLKEPPSGDGHHGKGRLRVHSGCSTAQSVYGSSDLPRLSQTDGAEAPKAHLVHRRGIGSDLSL